MQHGNFVFIFIRSTLEAIGFGPHMRKWVNLLYFFPMAHIRANDFLSTLFSTWNGKHQRYLLSPFISILTLEPFLPYAQANPNIDRIKTGYCTHKISAYADDILFFLNNPETLNLVDEFYTFNELSNLHINFQKPETLNVTLSPNTVQHLQSVFWAMGHAQILIRIPNLSSSDLWNHPTVGLMWWICTTVLLELNLSPWSSLLFHILGNLVFHPGVGDKSFPQLCGRNSFLEMYFLCQLSRITST